MHYISWYDVTFVYIILHFVLSRRLCHVTRVRPFWCIELSTAGPQGTQVLPTCSHSVRVFFMCRSFLSTHLPSWKRFRASYNCYIRRPFSISATVVVPLVIWSVQQPCEARAAAASPCYLSINRTNLRSSTIYFLVLINQGSGILPSDAPSWRRAKNSVRLCFFASNVHYLLTSLQESIIACVIFRC